MSYDSEKVKIGREPAYMVDLLLDYCDLTYGAAPCAAALGVTGTAKCFNTRATCQDAINYTPSPKQYRFTKAGDWPAGFARVASTLLSVDFSTTSIDPEGGLGQRAQVTLTFQDHPHHDRGIDKYVSDRSYDPNSQGTFWGRLRARNPYFKGRILRVWEGHLTDPFDINHFRSRDYITESISPPDSSGVVRVVGKDVLKLADGEKAVCPAPTTGLLVADLSPTTTTIKLTPGTGSQYDNDDHVVIGKEVIKFTGRTGDTLTGCERGQDDTEAESHDAGDSVQLCKSWTDENVVDIIYELLTDFAAVPAANIDLAGSWTTEKNTHLSTFILSNRVVKPTSVRELLQELMQQCLIAVWQDDLTSAVHLKSLTPWAESVASITDDEIIAGSISIGDEPSMRVSRVRVYHGIRNYVENDEPKNYRRLFFDPDFDLEGSDKFGEKAERVFFSRWFKADDITRPSLLASRLSKRFGEIPLSVSFALNVRHADFETGDVIDITTRMIQDAEGNAKTTRLLILKTIPDSDGHEVRYRGLSYSPVPDPVINVTTLTNQIDVFTWLSAPADAVDVQITNASGNIIYSDDPDVAAISSGPLNAGSTISLTNLGYIYGCGGTGGKGGTAKNRYDKILGWIAGAGVGFVGGDGGDAIETSVDITIDNSSGYIFGGGGGGAGGNAYSSGGTAHSGGGGGGGQSYEPTDGGVGGLAMTYSALATIYRDEAGNVVKANPFTNNDNGRYNFYAPQGSYSILLTHPDGTEDFESGINIPADVSSPPPTNIGSGTPRTPVTTGGTASGGAVRDYTPDYQIR